MKKNIIPIFLFLTATALSCNKDVTADCLQAKIIRVTCASTVIQVLNDSSVGEDGWKDTFNNNVTYDNVFAASNTCQIPSEYKTGDVIFITITRPAASDCVQCAMYDAPPKVTYKINSIGNLPCSEELPK